MGNKDLLGLSMSKSRRKPKFKLRFEWADLILIGIIASALIALRLM